MCVNSLPRLLPESGTDWNWSDDILSLDSNGLTVMSQGHLYQKWILNTLQRSEELLFC